MVIYYVAFHWEITYSFNFKRWHCCNADENYYLIVECPFSLELLSWYSNKILYQAQTSYSFESLLPLTTSILLYMRLQILFDHYL